MLPSAQRHAARPRLRGTYIDDNGAVSWAALVLTIGLLVASVSVFVYYWTIISRDDRDSKALLAQRRAEFDALQQYIDSFPTECDCESLAFEFPTQFRDDEFAVFKASDQPDDDTMVEFFISGGEQTLIVRADVSGTIAYAADIPVYPTEFPDDEFRLLHHQDTTRQLAFDCSDIGTGSTVTLTFQDASGVIALLHKVLAVQTVFNDDVFAVKNDQNPSKRVQFSANMLNPNSTVTLTVPDESGTIALLANLSSSEDAMFPESIFSVFNAADSSKTVNISVSNLVTPGSTSVMGVQNRNGTIAYRDQILAFEDFDITESRNFPDVAHEGVSTLEALGATRVEVWLCGGGGAGVNQAWGSSPVMFRRGGGGSGSGFDGFVIENAAARFDRFECTIGEGGVWGHVLVNLTELGTGDPTILKGVPSLSVLYPIDLELIGWGGAPGNGAYGNISDERYGGSGAGNGVDGLTDGDLGGLPQTNGVAKVDPYAPRGIQQSGGFRYPWRSGSHGGGIGDGNFAWCLDQSYTCGAAPMIGGGMGGAPVGIPSLAGGGGFFGKGGDTVFEDPSNPAKDAAPNTCAGGGASYQSVSASDPDPMVTGRGGSGRIYLRVWYI